ncbi:MAG: hypothetical protein QME60_02535 [Verrucomicrobiota bacterium]|nr:hypothetical protein [Verrucomicrobiota bacterium]
MKARRGQVTNNGSLAARIGGMLLLGMSTLYGATVGTESGGLVMSDSEGSTTYSCAPEGYVIISFGQGNVSPSTPPDYAEAVLVADGGKADSPFTGDYVADGVKGVTFRVRGDGHTPGSAMVILRSRSGRIWSNDRFQFPAEAGVWSTVTLSFERSAGWTRGGADLDAKWDADIRSVTLIGIQMSRSGTDAQSYTIDDFMLLDADHMPDALTPLERALRDRFGVTRREDVAPADQLVDTDFDGMTDLFEILSKYDSDFANAIFEAQILSVTDAGVTIRWTCVEGSKYTVLRGSQLTGGLDPLPDFAGLDMPATETGYMTLVDTDAKGSGPYYYRILKMD